jgi:ribonuclease E
MSDVSDSGASATGSSQQISTGGRNPEGGRSQEGGQNPNPTAEGAGGAPSKPKIGDTRPAPPPRAGGGANQPKDGGQSAKSSSQARRRRRRRGGSRPSGGGSGADGATDTNQGSSDAGSGQRRGKSGSRQGQKRSGQRRSRGQRSGDGRQKESPVSPVLTGDTVELDEEDLKHRRGRSRKGRPVGRYLMVVSKQEDATHIAILEGRTLIEYYVSRPSDNIFQIHGNIYLGRVQNVLPGMEAAFVDIGTPKNAVIYRGDVQYDKDDFDGNASPKIEQMLKARQPILCQVTKNPIAHKGARLTTEVSLPGRFVVLVPNSDTYGISKRLPDDERKRLRQILDRVRPKNHGLIVRTAAENVTAAEIERDVAGLVQQWTEIESLAKRSKAPSLLYQEPDMSVRVIREEFNKEYRGVVIDDHALHDEVAEYVALITPALADRVEYYDTDTEKLSLFERFHVHEQLHKALDRKVWLPSGGSLIIESTEALTVIDVNTGKNVGSSNLEDTVFQNNLEAAEGIAHQLRLRDIGGIIVIDFVDMESKKNRDEVMRVFRHALSRDKTRTQVFDISDLGLAEMTRKRIGEGLLESLSQECPHCEGRGLEVDAAVLVTDR